jgi:hypothetical protein
MTKKKVLPLDNVIYYPPRTRVLWNGEPGFVHSYHRKNYDYEVGYNIVLDSQTFKAQPDILNSSYHELVLEDTGLKSIVPY